ncbi:hypothetical protein [Actinomadura violacea]|uniref:Uncharacterized protein n=1 Tax=Actinomadura violacea TaxID=2819934 RepID=A0ABS3RY23_9ACTN|nr:hypothetical protein [Actinomadura violacea]MBO2461666.1 hypothetical protein [Actinomadura violacea]
MRLARAWPVDAELLAQVIEEISVLAADHRRRKPREVPRPEKPKPEPERRGEEGVVDVAPAVAVVKGAAAALAARNAVRNSTVLSPVG